MNSGFISLLLFFFFLILFLWVSLSSFRPSSSPSLQSTSCQASSVPLHAESQGSERMGAEVAVRGMESAATDLPAPEVTVAMAAGPSEGLALAS